jgi:hypothetical protein
MGRFLVLILGADCGDGRIVAMGGALSVEPCCGCGFSFFGFVFSCGPIRPRVGADPLGPCSFFLLYDGCRGPRGSGQGWESGRLAGSEGTLAPRWAVILGHEHS